jgi:hypothetical protein
MYICILWRSYKLFSVSFFIQTALFREVTGEKFTTPKASKLSSHKLNLSRSLFQTPPRANFDHFCTIGKATKMEVGIVSRACNASRRFWAKTSSM